MIEIKKGKEPDKLLRLDERLNLNSESISLPENRKQVLQALIDNVRKKCGTGDISLIL